MNFKPTGSMSYPELESEVVRLRHQLSQRQDSSADIDDSILEMAAQWKARADALSEALELTEDEYSEEEANAREAIDLLEQYSDRLDSVTSENRRLRQQLKEFKQADPASRLFSRTDSEMEARERLQRLDAYTAGIAKPVETPRRMRPSDFDPGLLGPQGTEYFSNMRNSATPSQPKKQRASDF